MSPEPLLPKYPDSGPSHPSGDAALSPALKGDEPLQQSHTLVLYVLAVLWMCLTGVPLVLLSVYAGGAVAGVGASCLLGGQVWLFTQIFAGNPAAAMMVWLLPVVGPWLAIQFIIDDWPIARWPVLCQGAGLVLWVVGFVDHLSAL